jgi:hypothetical protein
VALGLTGSGPTTSNLMTSGQVWLLLRQNAQLDGFTAEYELRAGASGGTVLASGTMYLSGYNPVALRYDPVARTLTANVAGIALGPFDVAGVAPRYVALEGQGWVDDFVVRSVL